MENDDFDSDQDCIPPDILDIATKMTHDLLPDKSRNLIVIAMARKGAVSIQDTIETNEEYEAYLDGHSENLIMMEVYADYCGYCLATANAVRKCKLDVGGDKIDMVKACTDNIDPLIRFRYKSEPTFLFIRNRKLKRVMFGANGIELVNICEKMLEVVRKEVETGVTIMPDYDIEETLPEETIRIEEHMRKQTEHVEAVNRLRELTDAARKRRMCARLAVQVRRMNWILFWPHNHQAHYDLYEKWDMLGLTVGAKETVELTEDKVREALYQSDVDLNDACMNSLTTGPALIVLFKMFETDNRDFVKLMRYAIYEEIPEPKEDVPPEKQLPPIPAFERYASISKTPREVRRDRYNAKMQKLREEEEERERLRKEKERLEREARAEEEAELKKKQEEERMARIAAGLPADPEPEPVVEPEEGAEGEEKVEGEEEGEGAEGEGAEGEAAEGEGAEAPPEEEAPAPVEEFHSDVSVEGEDYIPPGGLFVPGLYSPINDMAKANGLKLFFPKEVLHYTGLEKLESEVMPPHVLVMFNVDKRHELIEVFQQYKDEILNMGFFLGDEPYNMQHLAYTAKQYDKMNRLRKHLDRLAVAVSRKRSLPLLQLTGFNPQYISNDVEAGEKECLVLFPVGYGDDYVEEESVKEEEVTEIAPVVVETQQEAPAPEEQEEEEEVEIDI